MARSVALPALPTRPLEVARPVAGVVALLLVLLVVSPVAALLVPAPWSSASPWPLSIAARTLLVALGSTCVSFALALPIAVGVVRVDVPGRALLWRLVGIGALIPPFIVPLALTGLSGAWRQGTAPRGAAAIVVGQSLAFLPLAIVLVATGLARIPAELEQAAEVLGAPPTTVFRRVTLALVAPEVWRASLVILGLCLADLVTPVLLGGDTAVLATAILVLAPLDGSGAAGAAWLLIALAGAAALGAGARRRLAVPAPRWPSLPRLERATPTVLRWGLGVMAWGTTAVLAVLWISVPVGSLVNVGAGGPGVSLEHWVSLSTEAGLRMLASSVRLALGVAVSGTLLALAAAFSIERGGSPSGPVIEALCRVPLIVPGLAASLGYVLALGGPPVAEALTLPILVALIACWELPVTSRAVRGVLARTDRSVEDVALGLGASRRTTLTRILAPALWPVMGWLLGYLFAAAVLAIGTVAVVTGAARHAPALAMLSLAAAGATGAACAVATALLALAGGAALLGQAVAGRRRAFTWLA
jgi:iron(III) transport system permease protein